ncbi:MAG: iron complex outermembrane receptor protein [Flavobacteriales bacterium]|jgi:iron complex outermembrane receptor protein
MFAAEVNTFTLKTLAFSVALTTSIAQAQPVRDSVIAFDIPQQRADKSLTEFAKQANITLIFSFDAAMKTSANALSGEHSIEEALRLLLDNTDLRVKIGEAGQLSIATGPSLGENDLMHNKKTELSIAIAGVISTLIATQTMAQESPPTEEVVITGIRGSLQRSMDIKRESGGVVDAISAEDIGKFPDTNLAESLQRITGVSIDRTGGEGQFITVRGLGPAFNAVVVNGRRLASEQETRGFSFDTIASEMVTGLEVHKTSVATLPSGGVGATVNIKTGRPLDNPGLKIAGSIKANYEDKSGETSPQVSALFSNTFADDTIGVLLAVSNSERSTRIDQAQTNQWQPASGIPDSGYASGHSGAILAPQNFDQRVLFEERTRTNATAVVQFAPSDALTITGDLLYSDFDIEGEATSMGFWFGPGNFNNATVDSNGTVLSFDQGNTNQATDVHAKTSDRLTETISAGLNFDITVNDNLTLDVDLWRSESERESNNGNNNNMVLGYLRGSSYVADGSDLPRVFGFEDAVPDVEGDDTDGIPNTNNFIDSIGDPTTHAAGNYLDPSNPRAHVSIRGGESTGLAVKDDVTEFKIGGVWDEGADSGIVKAKFGAGTTTETRDIEGWDNTTSNVHATVVGYLETGDVTGAGITAFDIPDSAFSVFDAGSDFLGDLSVAGGTRMPTQWLYARDGEAIFDLFTQQTGIDHDAVKTGSSISVEETVSFAYLELDFAGEIGGMALTSTAGVRMESTDVTVSGTDVPLESIEVLGADQTQFSAVTRAPSAVEADTSNEALLPNFSAKLDITDSIVARFAAGKTLTRPTLRQLAPATNIGTTRPSILTASSGNPALKPFLSDNVDLSFEYYFGDSSYASFGYFQKNVSNFIVNGAQATTFFDSSGNAIEVPLQNDAGLFVDGGPKGPAVFQVALPTNGPDVKIDGIELAVQHTLDMGLGFQANYTMVNSDADFDVNDLTQTFAVPGISDSANLVGFYETDRLSVRLAYNWRDEFLQSLTQASGAGEPQFVETYSQWDLSASFDITDNITAFVEGINLTEEIVLKHGRYDNQFLSADDSGRRFLVGVRASF